MYGNFLRECLTRTLYLESRLGHLESAFQKSDTQGPIADLPPEMIYEVFGYLPIADLLNCEMYVS